MVTGRVGGTRIDQSISNQKSASFRSNIAASSSDVSPDAQNVRDAKIEMKGPAGLYPSNGLYYPQQHNLYDVSQPPPANIQGYSPYPIEFHNPTIDLQAPDYGFVSQAPGGPFSVEMQFQSDGSNGYMYGPQLLQYPTYPYYQQPSPSYLPPQSGIPAPGIVMSDIQDPRHLGLGVPNGLSSMNVYAGPVSGLSPSVSNEKGALPLTAPFPSPVLRSSAPRFMPKNQNEISRLGVPTQPRLPLNPAQSYRSQNGLVSKIGIPCTSASPNRYTAAKPKTTDGRPCNGDINGSSQILSKQKLMKEQPLRIFSGHPDTLNEQVRHESLQMGKSPQSAPMPTGRSESDGIGRKVEAWPSSLASDYDDAKFFVIKSYSEDNVHKSIKYNVWASTASGNKKLDEAYQDAQRRAQGKPHGCPVFLFFSVNGSRQFCGLAEMVAPVDYCKTMAFWEQHKWSGSFPVKWHIIKDLPNPQLRQILLENNENKPVTNSRDTQEVKFQQGMEMLNIFRSCPTRTSIMDDLWLHSNSQKPSQDMGPPQWSAQNFPKLPELVVRKKPSNEERGCEGVKSNLTTSKVYDGQLNDASRWKKSDKIVVSDSGVESAMQNLRLDKEETPKVSKIGEHKS